MSGKRAKKKRRFEDPDKAKKAELEEALNKLTPEEAEMFVQALELTMKKRRILLLGYVVSIIGLLVGVAIAFIIYGNREPGQFVGWAFCIPPAIAGTSLFAFGKYSRSIRK